MRHIRPFSLTFLASIILAASTAFGQIKPVPIDAESALLQYLQIKDNANLEEALIKWGSTTSEAQVTAAPIVLGFFMLEHLDGNIFTDAAHYEAYMTAVKNIEKGVAATEKSGNVNGLYLTSNDAPFIPIRYILANAYDRVYKQVEADSAYAQTAKEIGRDFGTNSEEFVFWSKQCAEKVIRKNKSYSKAIKLLLPAKEAAISSPEVSDTTACRFLNSLAQKYLNSGYINEAKKMAHEAEKRMGNDYSLVFNVSNTLGEIYWREGDHDKGSKYFKNAQTNAPSLSEFFAAGVNCANLMRQTGYFDSAETTLLALEKYSNSEELTVENLFNYYEACGVLYTFRNPAKSAECFLKAEKYINSIDYPSAAHHILNSQVYPNVENSFKVISALNRAETIYTLLIGDNPVLLNELLYLKGYYYTQIHNYKKARRCYETAFQNTWDYPKGDPLRLNVLKQLALLDEIENNNLRRKFYLHLQIEGAYEHGESSSLYRDAVADIVHYCLQTSDEEGSKYYFDLYKELCPYSFDSMCYDYRLKILQGKFDEAETILTGIKNSFPDKRNLVNLMFQRLYSYLKSSKITGIADTVFVNYQDEILRQLLFMSANERCNIDAELLSRRDEIISASLFAPELTELALNYSLFSKGLLFHTQTGIDKLLSVSDSAKIEMTKIKCLKVELAKAINSFNKEAAHSLQGEIDSRERYLIDDFLDYKSFSNKFNRYSSRKLFNSINPTDIIIDFVQYVDSGNTHIGGFIIQATSAVMFIDCGEVQGLSVDNASQKIWSKILTYATPENRIYFSTDGILNTLPIEFAEDENGVPMCEKYDLHRVFHLSDIRPEIGIGKRVEAIGVADHNSPARKARGLDDGYRENWSDLAGVETELFCIAENLDGASDYHRAFNDDATEQYVKSLSGQPITTLHIATHGFYRSEEEIIKAYDNPSDFDHNIAQRFLLGNRTSVSGLVMRNGNLSWKAEAITDDEDNILTSDEVESLSFPTLNLTVLSACETGLGDISADGVWDLQRAFRIAGTSSLICSLYKVKDNGTADFMSEFYHHAASGLSVHEAFYKARKELLKRDPAKKDAWSSFILIE